MPTTEMRTIDSPGNDSGNRAAAGDVLADIIAHEQLSAVFQPLFSLDDGALFGYEGLIRGPVDTPLHTPNNLFALADRTTRRFPLEIAAGRVVLRQFAARQLPGHLLLNLSCTTLLAQAERPQRAIEYLAASGVAPATIMIELTEHDRVDDIPALVRSLVSVRDTGISIVLDDFGDGHSNLRLWMELRPRLVKIDRFFVKGLGTDGDKFEIVRLLKRFADSFGTEMVAEGIEDAVDLLAARDLGIPLAQGFLLGRPETTPSRRLPRRVHSAIRASRLTPARARGAPLRITLAGDLGLPIPPIDSSLSNGGLAALFGSNPTYHAVALVDSDNPIGLISRQSFMDRWNQPAPHHLAHDQSCSLHCNGTPTMIDRRTPIESMRGLLSGPDQRYLREGFIVTDNGKYVGLATGESLVRAITELRVETPRYVNPLTFLPGNIPISQHLDRLVEANVPFTACYSDLNHFKPFNEQYGYWRGDEMIRLAAAVLHEVADAVVDFLGHVGGDDFFVIFQSHDWERRCRQAVERFNARARVCFSKGEIAANGYWGEGSKGLRCFFPLTTMSIGAVVVAPGTFQRHEEVAMAAARAKCRAKIAGVDLHIGDAASDDSETQSDH